MGWNGSDLREEVEKRGGGGQRKVKVRSSTSNFNCKALAVGVIIVALGCVALWWFCRARTPAAPQETSRTKHGGLIASHTPAPAPKHVEKEPVVEEEKEDIRDLPNGLQMKYHPDGSPAWAAPRQKPGKTFTNHVQHVRSREQEIFKNSADAEIAMMLNVEPGTQIIGSNDFAGFTERFQEALKEQIVLSADDDEETKELKQAVIDVREDFRKRMSQGENLSETMVQVRKDLQELGLYREELKNQVRQIAQSEESKQLTEKDFKDLIDAANLMLNDRGAKPISVPAFIKYRFERDIEEE